MLDALPSGASLSSSDFSMEIVPTSTGWPFVAGCISADNGCIFCRFVFVNRVRVVHTDHGLVGRNLDDVQLIDGAELLFLGQGGTGHAGELAVQTEVVLEGDGRQRLALVLDGDAFLGLDGLMQTIV